MLENSIPCCTQELLHGERRETLHIHNSGRVLFSDTPESRAYLGPAFQTTLPRNKKKKIHCNSFWGYASLHAIIVYLANRCLPLLWLFKAGVSWDSWLLLHSKTEVKLRFQYKQKLSIEERTSTLFGRQGKFSVHLCFTCKTLQVSQPQGPAACIHVLPCHQHVASTMTTHQL